MASVRWGRKLLAIFDHGIHVHVVLSVRVCVCVWEWMWGEEVRITVQY